MACPEWGTKRTCQSCISYFYDMKKVPILCPKCKSEYKLDEPRSLNSHFDEKNKEQEKELVGNPYKPDHDFAEVEELLGPVHETLESYEDLNDGFDQPSDYIGR